MKHYYSCLRTMVLLLAALLPYGCIGDDLSDCPPPDPDDAGVLLGFRFSPLDGNDIQADDLTCMDVFVFDGSGLYVSTVRDAAPRMQDEDYRIALTLAEGNYSFVAWGNCEAGTGYTTTPATFVKGVTSIDDALMSFARPANDTIRTTIGHLFHGLLSGADIIAQSEQTLFVPIVQNTYTINIGIAEFAPEAPPCRVVISDDHCAYGFDNQRITSQDIHYQGDCIREYGIQFTSLRTLRLTPTGETRLKLYSADGSSTYATTEPPLYDASLIGLISSSASFGSAADLDRVHTYNIRLTFDATNGQFTVTVNGWNVDNENHDIHPQ